MEQKKKFNSLKSRADLPSVEVPGVLEDGRVPAEMLNADLDVFVPTFDGLKKDDTLTLYINTAPSETVTVTESQAQDPDFKAAFTISQENYPAPGKYFEVSLDYVYFDSATQESSRSGAPLKVIFDREPPGGDSLRALDFSQVAGDVITEDNLVGGNLVVKAFAWYGMETSDVITGWASVSPPTPESIAQYLIPDSAVTVGEPGSPIPPGNSVELKFPRASFDGTGTRYFGYQLKDKLNNISAPSPYVQKSVDLAITDLN